MTPSRAALVAGGSSGIGLAIARTLLEEGHALTVVGRRAAKVEAATAELGPDASGLAADLSDEGEVRRALDAHRERFGRLDALVVSLGYGGPRAPLEELDTERLDRVLAVDLRAALLVTRACIPLLRESGAEHGKALVVHVSSVAAVLGVDSIPVYSAAKGGTAAFGRALQRDLADAGVQVTTLLPGYVETPMGEWIQIPREELLRPDDLAEGVRLLLRTSPACRIPELRFERRGGPV
jgi:NAD(P)-dependent dehydrogenase (short-subunit alcohol dehydrogenase family)